MSVIPEEGILFETKTFNWKMKLSKLLDLPQNQDLYSPIFNQAECEWKLSLHHNMEWIGGFLYFVKFKAQRSNVGKIHAKFRIKAEIVRPESRNLEYEESTSWSWSSPNSGCGFTKLLQFEPKYAGQDDILLVKCKIWTIFDEPGAASQRINKNFRTSLCTHIQSLLDDSILPDLTIQVGEEQLKAHKSILAARSPVFRRMFESEMVEAANSQLIIEDFSAKVVKQMLEFIYSGDDRLIGKNDVPLAEMLQISDKYSLFQLKVVCETLLGNNLRVNNVIEILIIADLQNAPTLKKQALEYIAKNSAEVFKTKAYLEMKSVEIIKEICSALSNEIPKPANT